MGYVEWFYNYQKKLAGCSSVSFSVAAHIIRFVQIIFYKFEMKRKTKYRYRWLKARSFWCLGFDQIKRQFGRIRHKRSEKWR